jgi:hypothetical protein
MSPQRWGALISGSALAIYGITRRSPLGIALAASGGTVALLAANRKSSPEASVSSTIPVVHVTIGGLTANLPDSNRVLNTGGVDSAGCPDTGFVAVRREESVPWTALN